MRGGRSLKLKDKKHEKSENSEEMNDESNKSSIDEDKNEKIRDKIKHFTHRTEEAEEIKYQEEQSKMLEEIKAEKLDASVAAKRRTIHRIGIGITIVIIAITVYAFKEGYFVDQHKFGNFLAKFGFFAPIVFIAIQAFFTVFPVNPSGITNLSVVLAYGPLYGFLLNYVAIMIGSIINFFLGRKFGKKFVGLLFDEETINKQVDWLNKGNKIEKMFIIVLIVPFLPDDISCMICGMTNFKFSRFLAITAFFKIWAIGSILFIMQYGYEALYRIIF